MKGIVYCTLQDSMERDAGQKFPVKFGPITLPSGKTVGIPVEDAAKELTTVFKKAGMIVERKKGENRLWIMPGSWR